MQRSEDTFHLVDLASQAEAVQSLLAGRSNEEKVAWLERHGVLSPISADFGGDSPVYQFESTLGLKCAFFLKGESLVFKGDNTTWSVPRLPATLDNQTPMNSSRRILSYEQTERAHGFRSSTLTILATITIVVAFLLQELGNRTLVGREIHHLGLPTTIYVVSFVVAIVSAVLCVQAFRRRLGTKPWALIFPCLLILLYLNWTRVLVQQVYLSP